MKKIEFLDARTVALVIAMFQCLLRSCPFVRLILIPQLV